jgi:hypothetical protein
MSTKRTSTTPRKRAAKAPRRPQEAPESPPPAQPRPPTFNAILSERERVEELRRATERLRQNPDFMFFLQESVESIRDNSAAACKSDEVLTSHPRLAFEQGVQWAAETILAEAHTPRKSPAH